MSQNRKKPLGGFILGMSVIILSAAIIISISISTIVLRDLKISSVASDSQLAYGLADAAMNCFFTSETEFGYDDPTGRTRLFPVQPTNLRTWFLNMNTYRPATIKCFDVNLFSNSMINNDNFPTTLSQYNTTGSVGGAEYVASTTIDTSPISTYSDGAVTRFFIKRSDFPKDACVDIEIHTSPDNSRLIISRGKVPCFDSKRVERSLNRIIQ